MGAVSWSREDCVRGQSLYENETRALEFWMPQSLDIGMRYDPKGWLRLRPEGRCYIAAWGDIRAVGLTPGDAVRELTLRLYGAAESLWLNANPDHPGFGEPEFTGMTNE